jgi:hypothetical protein
VKVQPITRTILRVTLHIKGQFEWSDRLSATVEPFWVWVEDNENERIYHTEYFLLHKKQVYQTPYSPHPITYTLHSTTHTLHPALYTPYPTPYNLHPTPCTLHSTPHTLHPATQPRHTPWTITHP